jgi:thymidylate kinase
VDRRQLEIGSMRTRKGSFVAIVGPDGVGKTTLANRLLDLAPQPTGYVHFRPRILDSLPSRPGSLTVVSPDKHPPKNRLLGWLRLIASVPRFWLGYLTKIKPLLKKGGTVVADRWVYGYVAQPEALRFFGPESLARLAIRIMPRPDLVINLAAPPEVIASRKAELSVEEITAELSLWESLPVKPLRTLDASLPPEDLAVRALSELDSIAGTQRERARRDGV